VMGNQTSEPEGRAKALAQLRAIYLRDYIGQWRTFLGAATVQPFTSVQEGARNLAVLSGNQSPLLALFSLVSRHTAVDTVDIGAAFQPVQVVTPAKDTAKFIGPSNEPYINALGALQASLERISKGTPEEADAVLAQATTDAAQARTATKQIANKFRIDGVAKVDVTVQKLMEAPIKYAEAALQTVGPAQLSAKGKAFCAPFQQLLTKYPFNPAGSVPAGLDEVSGLLQPGTGFLWTSVQGQLANVVVRQGSQFAEKPGSTVRVSPAFLAFLKDPINPRWVNDKAVKLFRTILKKYNGGEGLTDYYNVYGMSSAFTLVDALKHSGKNPTRASVMHAVTHLNERNNPFVLPGIVVKTTATNRFPITQARLERYHNGQWVYFGPLVHVG